MINAFDFYKKYKDCQYIKPSTITDDAGWFYLPLKIDLKQWQYEVSLVDEFYVPHRSLDSQGWSSCCLHGLDISYTEPATSYGFDEFTAPYQWTSLSELTPTITQFFKEIFPADRYKRIRFMKLEPNGYINPHNDAPKNYQPINKLKMLDVGIPCNIAVVHPDNCYMTFEGIGIVPWVEGDVIVPDVTKTHSLINLSNRPRIHIIADCIIGSKKEKFLNLINEH